MLRRMIVNWLWPEISRRHGAENSVEIGKLVAEVTRRSAQVAAAAGASIEKLRGR
jgi:hypothetical protein